MAREWLKEIRVERGMAQSDVAKAAGITQQSYSSIELGTRLGLVSTAKRIAEVLGFDWRRFYENV